VCLLKEGPLDAVGYCPWEQFGDDACRGGRGNRIDEKSLPGVPGSQLGAYPADSRELLAHAGRFGPDAVLV
jgi:hypothetical protein